MSSSSETLCFTCGLPIGEVPRINHLANGRVCPTCLDRLLEMLPPLLPGEDPLAGEELEGGALEAEVLEADQAARPADEGDEPEPERGLRRHS